MSTLIQLADKVLEKINTLDLGEDFNAERVYLNEPDKSELDNLSIRVLPGPLDISLLTRGSRQWDYEINVAIVKKSDDRPDGLMNIVETVMDAFSTIAFSVNSSNHSIARIEQTNPYDDELLRNEQIFQSIFTLGFRVNR